MEPVLVIVDVQYPYVPTANEPSGDCQSEKFLQNVVKLAQDARATGIFIVVLEAAKASPTQESVRAVLAGYERVVLKKRHEWNGSAEVRQALQEENVIPDSFLFCGAFAQECVMHTLVGVMENHLTSSVVVFPDACLPLPGSSFDWISIANRYGLRLAHTLTEGITQS